MSDSLIPPGWLLEVRCAMCHDWHEVTERVTFGGVPILVCPAAPPRNIWGFSNEQPEYRVRER